ncbi:MAG: ImmA/IrrE family metallo-endopeptidase [Chloroflexi bacterium]|nr:ImmA/IrrE family metallo-endopeptidase [Chloroflexota bacterium]
MADLGERLKMARRMAGLSLRATGEAAGVSHTAVAKYERGQMVPSSAVLLRLAQALGVELDYLFRPASVVLTAKGVHYRCQKRRGAKDRRRIEGLVAEYLERFIEAERLFGAPASFSTPPIDRHASSLEDVERIALALREHWHLGNAPIVNLMALLEDRAVRVCVIAGCDGFDGLGAWVADGIPVIGVQRGIPGDRQRFSLAHELAHLLLDLAPEVYPEKAAHRFAGAFLAPEPSVRAELGARRQALDLRELDLLKHKYGLSMLAWVHRARDLQIIDEATYRRICRAFAREGWKKREPWEQVPPEEPQRLRQLVYRALGERMISRSRAEELLSQPLVELEAATA